MPDKLIGSTWPEALRHTTNNEINFNRDSPRFESAESIYAPTEFCYYPCHTIYIYILGILTHLTVWVNTFIYDDFSFEFWSVHEGKWTCDRCYKQALLRALLSTVCLLTCVLHIYLNAFNLPYSFSSCLCLQLELLLHSLNWKTIHIVLAFRMCGKMFFSKI